MSMFQTGYQCSDLLSTLASAHTVMQIKGLGDPNNIAESFSCLIKIFIELQ